MNAKQMFLEYAAKHNDGALLNNEQFVGKMIVEGVCISRSGGTRVNARARREGKTLILTETTIEQTIEGHNETTVEIFRVDL